MCILYKVSCAILKHIFNSLIIVEHTSIFFIKMGIPSYYKRVSDSVPGLTRKSHPGTIHWLWMDFNCLIYHTLHSPHMAEYSPENQVQWEYNFIDAIIQNCLGIVKEVQPQTGVYIAIDGVVPMAKMRQQRLRRFKSAWERDRVSSSVWDTNAITPGTAFMDKLKSRLELMMRKQKKSMKWILSASDEPGEGEHKIMAQWRRGCYNGNFAIYGLDADLIVLSLLTRELVCEAESALIEDIWLFREDVQDGSIVRDDDGNDTFVWFSIDRLRIYLLDMIYLQDKENKKRDFLYSYVCAMCTLGNDFLPTSASFKIREDGHDILLELMAKHDLMIIKNKEICMTEFMKLVQLLANSEEERILMSIRKKMSAAKRFADSNDSSITSAEECVGDPNWPLMNVAEKCLLENDSSYKPGLRSDWKEIYLKQMFPNSSRSVSILEYCTEYLKGVHWVWNYYCGKMEYVSYDWYYPWSVAPLWSWLIDMHKHCPTKYDDSDKIMNADEISPSEQLSIVLPLQSWHLIRSSEHRMLPVKAPWLFPTKFGFSSFGKRWFWECEAEIPIPSIHQIKSIIAR